MDLSLSTKTYPREEALPPVCDAPPLPSTLSTPSTVSSELTGSVSETTDNDETFTTVRRRRPERHRNSSNGDSTVIDSKAATNKPFIITILPGAEVSVNMYNTVKFSRRLDSLVPDEVMGLNKPKNLIAVDTSSTAARDTHLEQITLCGTGVHADLLRNVDSLPGAIQDVDSELSLEEPTSLLRADVEVQRVRRLGTSTSVCITFAGKVIPAYVKVGYVRQSVRPYESRPLQCKKCHELGHIAACCTSGARCTTCSGLHDSKECISDVVKRINCGKPHEATSPRCPNLRRDENLPDALSHASYTFGSMHSGENTKEAAEKT